MNKSVILFLAIVSVSCMSCGTMIHPSDATAPASSTNTYVISSEYAEALELVRESNFPYLSEIAGAGLALLTAYTAFRNRRLKKVATVLTDNIDTLKGSIASDGDRAIIMKTIASDQTTTGTRGEISKLRH